MVIGASQFDDINIQPLANVEVNLKLLIETFIDFKIAGLPEKNIYSLLDFNKIDTLSYLENIVSEISIRNSTLFIYYSGHGLLSVSKKTKLF